MMGLPTAAAQLERTDTMTATISLIKTAGKHRHEDMIWNDNLMDAITARNKMKVRLHWIASCK